MKEVKKRMAQSMRVCIDHYDRMDASGRVYSRLTGQELYFASLAELFLKADEVLDRDGGPQAFQEKRTFFSLTAGEEGIEETEPPKSSEEIAKETGKAATCDIVIQSRMHTSWQGFVKRTDGSLAGIFESELQLMRLLLDGIRKESNT